MTGSPDVVVIGCGALGLSIALHLARSGASVVALDRFGPGQQTSARAAGQSVIAQTDPAMGELMHRSIGRITGFEDRTGVALPYRQVGSVKYACSPWAAQQLHREVQRASALGARVSMVGLDTAADLAPHTNPGAAVAAWHAPDDIYFDPTHLTRAFHRAAVESGVEFRLGLGAHAISARGGRVTGVDTADGELPTTVVVVAAGGWTTALLHTAGVGPLPLTYVRHQYSIRSGVPGIGPDLPSVRVVDHAVYARPEGTRLMFGTYEPSPLEFDPGALPGRAEDVPLDATAVNEALARVADLFPAAADSTVHQMRGGLVTMTPDGRYLIDEAPATAGLFFLTGCNVMGLSVSPAVGEDVAAWITTGRRPSSLQGFAASRFDGIDTRPEIVRRQALREYEAIYRDDISAEYVRACPALPAGRVHGGQVDRARLLRDQ